MEQQVHRFLKRGLLQAALQLFHSGNPAANDGMHDVRTCQVFGTGLNGTADARPVIPAGRDMARQPVPEQLLHFRKAGKPEVLGKPDHRAGLHLALLRHLLDGLNAQLTTVLPPRTCRSA